jgi:hypothetical protein
MKSQEWYAREVNGFRAKQCLIGYVHTHETKEHRILYETASWYTLVDVPAGSYEAVMHYGLGINWVFVRYNGLITKEHFVNRLLSSSSVHEPTNNIGKPRKCTAQLYPYIAAAEFANNPDWELAEDWQVTGSSGVSNWDGVRSTFYKLSPVGVS